jgi:hypothetical protein
VDFLASNLLTAGDSNSAKLNFGTGSFSVSMWGYFRDFTYPKAWFMAGKASVCYQAGNPGWEIGHSYVSNGIAICYSDGTNLVQNGSVSFDAGYRPVDTQNKWTHFVAVVDKSAQKIKFYVNGVKQTNEYDISTVTGSVNNSSGVLIGSLHGWQTDGKLDDVRAYNRALSATDVSNLYTSGAVVRKNVSNNGLVGYYPMNEGVGLQAGDFSGRSNNGTIAGAPTWVDGKRGKALNFSGTNDVITAPAVLSGNSPFTAVAWVKPGDTTTAWKSIFGTTCNGFDVAINAATFEFGKNCGGGVFYGGPTVTANKWYHVAAVFDGTNINLYVNNVLTTGGVVSYAHDILRIGGSYSSVNELFKGVIDDVRIYNRALSAAEVSTLYNLNETNVNHSQDSKYTNGLVSFWSFNGPDVTSSTSTEVTGLGKNGTLHGGVTSTLGKVGQAANFDGSTGYYIMAPDDTHFVTGASGTLSFSFWIKSNNYTGTVLSRRHPCDNDGPFTITVSGQTVSLYFYSDLETGGFSYTSGNVLTTNEWNHVVITKQWGTAGATKLYINGVSKTFTPSGSDSARGTTYTGLQEYIGAQASTSGCNSNDGPVNGFFNGSIDEVRIYNRILSATEANQLYLLGK